VVKDKRIFFNPVRMISPRLDSEATRLEELHQQPVSESFTFEEGLLVMLSKLIEMVRLIHEAYMTNSANGLKVCRSLAQQVDDQEKLLLSNLTCAASIPPELCKTFVMFPNRLGRVCAYLERILACCEVKCSKGLNFSDMANKEVDQTFKLTQDMMTNFRDTLIAPNGFLLEHVISQAKELDQMCQDWQLAHVERLLHESCAPRSSSVFLDLLESTQSLGRHIKEMAEKMHDFVQAFRTAG
jgi:Na+/phosphate symporter